ncbi:MAG: LAGLIDADG family homing endonuclease [Candidatus Micrarchaeota archaeon]
MGDEILQYGQLVSVYGSRFRPELRKRWFPLSGSPDLAQIVAALMSDGHIGLQVRNAKPKLSKVVLYSSDKGECAWFLGTVCRIFGIDGKIIRYRSASGFSCNYSYKALLHCSELAKVLVAIGVPCGDKTIEAYPVPDWIMRGDSGTKRAFLRILFNFDGSVSLRSRRPNSIEMNFAMNKHKKLEKDATTFLEQVAKLLLEFGVRAGKIHIRPCKKEKMTLILFITNARSIINFHRKIGFLNEKKIARLETAVANIEKYGRARGVSEILEEVKGKLGTDREAVLQINEVSNSTYTARQFEHMRRGESDAPFPLLKAAFKILGREMPDLLTFTWTHERH